MATTATTCTVQTAASKGVTSVAIQLQSTASVASNGVKILCYGQAGSGKTQLIASLPAPIIISVEKGLLTLSDANLPFIEVESLSEFSECRKWLASSAEAVQFKTIAVDSISALGETILSEELKKNADGRKAYGEMQGKLFDELRELIAIPNRHLYATAKLEKLPDELGRILYGPSLPGRQAPQLLPHAFDEVFALRVEKGQDGNPQRMVMCHSDGLWAARDRSKKLAMWEPTDMGYIINKIMG